MYQDLAKGNISLGLLKFALLNVGLDLCFVLVLHRGVAGAATTVIAQYVSGVGLTVYTFLRCRELLP